MDAMLAVDLNSEPEVLIAAAAAWAARVQATLHLRTVSPLLWNADDVFGSTEYAALAKEWERRTAREEQEVHALLHQVPKAMRGSAEVLRGQTYQALAEASASYDLLILGTHGRTGLKRLFLGSVAEPTLRAARCPTLVIPLAADPIPLDGPLHILLPFDADEPVPHAVDWIREHLGVGHSQHAVYVMPPPGLAEVDPSERMDTFEANIRRTLADTEAPIHLLPPGMTHPGDALASYAEAHEIQLIAMPTHGRQGLAHLALGSVAERTVRRAPCAVLVLHER